MQNWSAGDNRGYDNNWDKDNDDNDCNGDMIL